MDVVETVRAQHQLAQHQWCPPLSHDLGRKRERAELTVTFHGISLPENAG
jgi:hypothetical protein